MSNYNGLACQEYLQGVTSLSADEAHHSLTGSWAKIAEAFPEAFVLGVTATPERLGGRGLCDAFDEMVVGSAVAGLVDLGLLGAPDRLCGRTARSFRCLDRQW